MPYTITTNFKATGSIDLGTRLITKDYLLDFYGNILPSLTTTPGLFAWGDNDYGQNGVNGGIDRPTPVATTSSANNNWKQISSFHFHTSVINTSGELWSWGFNGYGGLGVANDTTNRLTPTKEFNSATTWRQVSTGTHHTCSVKTDGTLWCWGRNQNGQLGVNDTTNRNTPVQVGTAVDWRQVDCGQSHSSAIKINGTLWSWGNNYSGQLGINNTTQKNTPVPEFNGAITWKSVACGGYTTSAIKTDGTLWSWGFNTNGQTGNNGNTNVQTPVQTLAGGTNWKQVSAGKKHTVAIKTDGTLWSWGINGSGQLGVNGTTTRFTPVQEFNGAQTWNSVACGGYTTSAIKTDGTLWMWGYNNQSQIGLNDTTSRQTPVTVGGGNNWKKVAAGYQHTAAIKSTDLV